MGKRLYPKYKIRRYMRYIALIILMTTLVLPCSAEVKLYRYFDKVTGEEKGICYSDKDGNPQKNGLEVVEIAEKDKEYYIGLLQVQKESKPAVKSDIEIRLEAVEAVVEANKIVPINEI